MASTYKTPGVYVEEISTLPASVAQVETAIPAFIGYTETASKKGKDLNLVPTRIKSLLEYEEYFGDAPDAQLIEVDLDSDNNPVTVDIVPDFYLYDSLRLYFDNGGGPCYIVSVNEYTDETNATNTVSKDDLISGITALTKYDEPTLILFPDGIELSATQLGDVQKAALSQCNTLQDRFTIMDVKDGDEELSGDDEDPSTIFRSKVGVNYLKYGAAYYPYLRTTLSFKYSYADIALTKNGTDTSIAALSPDTGVVDQLNNVLVDLDGDTASGIAAVLDTEDALDIFSDLDPPANKTALKTQAERISALANSFQNVAITDYRGAYGDDVLESDDKTGQDLLDNIIGPAGTGASAYGKLEEVLRTLALYNSTYSATGAGGTPPLAATLMDNFGDYDLTGLDEDNTGYISIYEAADGSAQTAAAAVDQAWPYFVQLYDQLYALMEDFYSELLARKAALESLLKDTNPIYANVVAAIDDEGIVLPPSGAMAGIYASVDRDRGVWKAPANVSLTSVSEPVIAIDNSDQDGLNVDTNAGKSINAIRSFTGKGVLVWGARTLAGNDNEWRYISVRRFYNMVEESVKKATESMVFEPNDANTWVRVRSMIENYLTRLWRAGALAGAKADQSFFVKVGLGETMTNSDILEGRMIVEIGMAVVRPAEFIILKFSHKMQEA